jgi:hypothetical protein
VNLSQIAEAQIHVAAAHLQLGVAEDALKAEHISAVLHIGQCERVAQRVEGAAHSRYAQLAAKLLKSRKALRCSSGSPASE